MNLRIVSMIPAVALSTLMSTALAQAPAAPAAAPGAAPTVPSIPSHNCIPPTYPGKQASNDKIKAFNAAYTEYGDCIKKYVESVRAIRDAAMTKGNEAVTEYNKFTEEMKKTIDADTGAPAAGSPAPKPGM
jgi:hypothetical protein